MSNSALERYRPAQPPAMRTPSVRTSTAPVVRRTLGPAGWFFAAVIVFVSAGALLGSVGIL